MALSPDRPPPPPSLPNFVSPLLLSPSPPHSPAHPPPSPSQKLAEKLGQGAFGSVYKVRSLPLYLAHPLSLTPRTRPLPLLVASLNQALNCASSPLPCRLHCTHS